MTPEREALRSFICEHLGIFKPLLSQTPILENILSREAPSSASEIRTDERAANAGCRTIDLDENGTTRQSRDRATKSSICGSKVLRSGPRDAANDEGRKGARVNTRT